MLPWFYLGTVYKTMPHSLHYRRIGEQTDSLDLIKVIHVTLIASQPESRETFKRVKVIKSIPYSCQSQIHASYMH